MFDFEFLDQVEDVPCGNLCALAGIDMYIIQTATISIESTYPFFSPSLSINFIVKVAVEPKFPQDLPKFVEGLKRLAKCNPLVRAIVADSGEHIVEGIVILFFDGLLLHYN